MPPKHRAHHLSRAHGFTLIEVLLAVSVIGILSAFTLPFASSLLVRHDVDIAAATITQQLQRAQILSQSGAQDSTWGVYTQSGIITLYKGSSFATRDTIHDETVTISSGISLSGDIDIAFSKLFGDPSGTKSLTITEGNESLTITLNSRGLASY